MPSPGEQILRGIPDTPVGIEHTIARMTAYVEQSRDLPEIRALALSLVVDCEGLPARAACEALSIYTWVRKHVRFEADPKGKERIQTPGRMIEQIRQNGVAQEDCDSISTFLLTLLQAAGHREAGYVFGGNSADGWQHVWIADLLDGGYIHLDASEGLDAGLYYGFPQYLFLRV